jgi:hypothetical protein
LNLGPISEIETEDWSPRDHLGQKSPVTGD